MDNGLILPQQGLILPQQYGGGYGQYGHNSRQMPQDNPELVRRLAIRWLRAADPHYKWAKVAKRCTEMLEGLQWTEEEKAILSEISRSALTINKIAPLYRLVMGYQSSNRTDLTFLPTSDSVSSEDVASVLTSLFKIEGDRDNLVYTDTDVFSDGIVTGRGFWGSYLNFDNNDLGEICWKAEDPFAVYVDPDCSTYDLDDRENGAAYIQKSVWKDLDYIESNYGAQAADAVENVYNASYQSSLMYLGGQDEISPRRSFGEYVDDKAMNSWDDVFYTDFVDRQAKRVRILDSEYKITQIMPCFVDLETGQKKAIPEEWFQPENQHRIQAALDYGMMKNNPIRIVQRPVTRIRRTITCADIMLYDDWSIYDKFTTTGYFPYFRRGKTRGMIEDMIDPQRELNKKRSVLTDILNRSANSGWIWEDGTLDAEQEDNLRKYGSSPGIHVKYSQKGQNGQPPRRLEPGQYPQGLDRLEEKAAGDLHQISGINESALGQLDRVQSGRAIEARQRQAVLSIQMYSDNFGRSKKLQGVKALDIFQRHYTEERVYREIGEDSSMSVYEINKKMQTGDNSIMRLNDITIGDYSVKVDEVPISATFKQGQFEETMMILEKLGPIGMALAQSSPDLIIDQTSLPRKNEWKQALMQASQVAQAGQAVPQDPNAPPQEPMQTSTPEGMVS